MYTFCVPYSNLNPVKTITTVLREKWRTVGILYC